MVLRTLLIGTGFRITNNFIPALGLLASSFRIIGVHSRNPENVSRVSRRWNIPPVPDLDNVDFSAVDLLILSVAIKSVPGVLQRLAPYATGLSLVIDTPVLPNPRDRKSRDILCRFKKTVVAEDYMCFLPFSLMRRTCADGHIGEITHVNLFHSGWQTHAFAVIRSFLGFRRPWMVRRWPVDDRHSIYEMRFGLTARAAIVEPYRRSRGSILVVGTKGKLTDFSDDTGSADTLYVKPFEDKGRIRGYRVLREREIAREEIPDLAALSAQDFDDKSDFNLMRNSALLGILKGICEPTFTSAYDYREGLFDHSSCYPGVIAQLLDPLALPFDRISRRLLGK